MKVKIGNTVYDANETPIAIIFEGNDKENIKNMAEEATVFVAYPDIITPLFIRKWLEGLSKNELL